MPDELSDDVVDPTVATNFREALVGATPSCEAARFRCFAARTRKFPDVLRLMGFGNSYSALERTL